MGILYSEDPGQMREMLGWPDDVLGKFILGRFIQITAEKHGIDGDENVTAAGNVLIEALRSTPSLETKDIPLEKSLRLAAIGEWGAAGRIFRNRLLDGGLRKITEDLAALALGHKAAQSERASNTRKKNITKDILETYRDDFYKKYAKYQGWKTSACSEFGIDLKTLNKRIKE